MAKIMEADASAGDAYAKINLGANYSELWIGLRVLFTADALALWTSGGSGSFIYTDNAGLSDGETFLNIADGLWLDDAGAPVAGLWQELTIHWTQGGTIDLKVNGAPTASIADPTTSDRRFLQFGDVFGTPTADEIIYIDDVTVGTTEGGTDIFEDDFESGTFGAWTSTSGDVSIIEDAFGGLLEGICVASDPVMTISPAWTRLDVTYNVTEFGVSRGRTSELDQNGPGSGWIELVDTTDAFDPSGAPQVQPLFHAAICLFNPVTETWSTLLRGYVSAVRWTPFQHFGFANVRIEIQDALAMLAAAEMVPDGSWGDDVIAGNIVFNEDTGTDAVQTRIGQVLDQAGWPANSAGTDGVADGSTTFTSASASFGTAAVGQFIIIQSKGRFKIVARTDANTITLNRTVSADTGLAYTYGLRAINSGNVKLLGGGVNGAGTYAPRTSALTPILDAVEAEFPFVAQYFVNADGQMDFRGRLARFDPSAVDYHISEWAVGDASAVAGSPSTIVPLSPPLHVYMDNENLYSNAIATPQGIADGDIAGQYATDPTSEGQFGLRTWSAENLLTGGGVATNALEETALFAQYYLDNLSTPQVRVGTLTIRPHLGVSAAATWALLCGVEISDIIAITTTHGGGGGFSGTQFFVEGIHYQADAQGGPLFTNVTATFDVSPSTYFDSNPFT